MITFTLIHSDCRLGYVWIETDNMYCMDDYGNLIRVSWDMHDGYFQEH